DRARLLYQLEEIDGAWKLVDVTAEGVSLVHNYREDFRAQLRDKDLEAVIEEMAERNREIGFE
ncbi:MAG: ABC transporter substrate-binding protein, partial [Halorhodospira sp.]